MGTRTIKVEKIEISGIKNIDYIAKIQRMAKLIPLTTLRFKYVTKLNDKAVSYCYEIESTDYNKLGNFLNSEEREIKKISFFKKFYRKIRYKGE